MIWKQSQESGAGAACEVLDLEFLKQIYKATNINHSSSKYICIYIYVLYIYVYVLYVCICCILVDGNARGLCTGS